MPNITSNQIYSQSAKQYWQAWLIALVWNAAIWFAIIKTGNNILAAFAANPVFYFFISFPSISLWLIFQAIKQTLAWYKFGKTPLTLNPFPGQIGGRCAGQLDLPVPAKTSGHAILSLSCIRRYHQRNNNGKSSWHTQSLWQDKITLKPENYGQRIRINFTFNPPADLPETEPVPAPCPIAIFAVPVVISLRALLPTATLLSLVVKEASALAPTATLLSPVVFALRVL